MFCGLRQEMDPWFQNMPELTADFEFFPMDFGETLYFFADPCYTENWKFDDFVKKQIKSLPEEIFHEIQILFYVFAEFVFGLDGIECVWRDRDAAVGFRNGRSGEK